MAHSGKLRHRDREPARRDAADDTPSAHRVFRMTTPERQRIAQCLRHIDEAREDLERQHNATNRGIVRDLRASADEIFDVLNGLEVIDE